MIELTFLKELTLIKQAHQKNVMFVTIDISIKSFNEEIETIPKNFNEKILTCKTESFVFYLHFCTSKECNVCHY